VEAINGYCGKVAKLTKSAIPAAIQGVDALQATARAEATDLEVVHDRNEHGRAWWRGRSTLSCRMNRCCDTGAEAAARWSGTPRGIATALESCINFDQRFMDPSPSRSRVLDISIRGQTIDKNMKEAIYGAVQHRRVEDVLSGAVQGPTSARRPTRRESGARNLCAAHHSPLRRALSVAREIFARLLHGERRQTSESATSSRSAATSDIAAPTVRRRDHATTMSTAASTASTTNMDPTSPWCVGAAPDEPLAMTTGVAMGKAHERDLPTPPNDARE
jgi:hypothetical protein